ncbi:hydantoinase/oxoprolinase family protein [Natrarchaeobius chitinivorans]|uniref:Hydantoinase/oxoprolinase family protein n=1 Tax=Natrarchaeobius chitinivorans TaxID=1679083 RepID=A0A3N6LRC2_NATCH|nr:hydantoinase/oxoprolinase family protein [Natrarchaeobius chitinivorans]RQG89654.1 hydantoinase/oxoprolinase family protein [Natrarchaeobius chitinivorans]
MSYKVTIDIGGTFTDLYLQETETGRTDSVKVPTTPDEYTRGFFDALDAASSEQGLTTEEFLERTTRLVHGTTIATNAIIEETTAETALLTTEGFRDTLVLREGGKEDPYDWQMDYPEPYVPRSQIYGIPERIDAEGDVVTPLDEEAVRETVDEIRSKGIDSIAVSYLWSHANAAHERRTGEIIDSIDPSLHCSLSHEVNPIIREYRRTVSTCIDASLHNQVSRYFEKLSAELAEIGFDGEPLIITANGGVMSIDEIVRTPVWLVDAGPTMLPVAADRFVGLERDSANVIALDMGGTSLDMSLVNDGTIPRTREAEIGDDLLGIEKVEVKSIGSGGGSIAWVDEGGLLRVGPESASAVPGPACYLRGGERPTVTDAALVLGYLSEERFLGGDMQISRDAAEAALEEHVGDPLGISPLEAARSVVATANQDMINGIRETTIQRGVDLRNYVLSGGGGALGVHAAMLAKGVGVEDVVLPRNAGVVSSIGGVVSDVRRDFSASHFTESDRFDHDGVDEVLTDLEAQAIDFFDRTGFAEADRSIEYYTEARYPRQVWELEVPIADPPIEPGDEADLVEAFHQTHDDTYGFRMDDQDVEFLYWRLEATGQTDGSVSSAADGEATGSIDEARYERRQAYFDGELHSTPVFDAAALSPGQETTGPAIVDSPTTTVIVPPGDTLSITEHGNYHVSVGTE